MLERFIEPSLLHQLELLRLRSRRSFLGTHQGVHLSPKRGHGIEFSDYRKYELGDDPRHIDWSVYARNERLYVKLFREEQDLSVLLMLDGSASMVTPAKARKWELSQQIASALAYVSLMQHDRVAIAVPGLAFSPFFKGGGAIHSAARFLAELRPGNADNLLYGVRQAVSRVRFPGLVAFISDFLFPLTEVREIFGMLLAKNLDITAIQVLSDHDENPCQGEGFVTAVDCESRAEARIVADETFQEEYALALSEHIASLRAYLNENRISYCLAHSSRELAEIVVDELIGTVFLQ